MNNISTFCIIILLPIVIYFISCNYSTSFDTDTGGRFDPHINIAPDTATTIILVTDSLNNNPIQEAEIYHIQTLIGITNSSGIDTVNFSCSYFPLEGYDDFEFHATKYLKTKVSLFYIRSDTTFNHIKLMPK